MNIKKCATITASAVIGLNRGYTNQTISTNELKNAVQKIQIELRDKRDLYLSVKITACEILFLGQDEPSVTLDFIQYPKFQYKEEKWKEAVLFFIEKIIDELEQNRTVIIFPDTTFMLEKSENIDPKIEKR